MVGMRVHRRERTDVAHGQRVCLEDSELDLVGDAAPVLGRARRSRHRRHREVDIL